jgi:hypothetical protein
MLDWQLNDLVLIGTAQVPIVVADAAVVVSHKSYKEALTAYTFTVTINTRAVAHEQYQDQKACAV